MAIGFQVHRFVKQKGYPTLILVIHAPENAFSNIREAPIMKTRLARSRRETTGTMHDSSLVI